AIVVPIIGASKDLELVCRTPVIVGYIYVVLNVVHGVKREITIYVVLMNLRVGVCHVYATCNLLSLTMVEHNHISLEYNRAVDLNPNPFSICVENMVGKYQVISDNAAIGRHASTTGCRKRRKFPIYLIAGNRVVFQNCGGCVSHEN